MGLNPNDQKPTGIALSVAYEKIRNWYQSNLLELQAQPESQYRTKSIALINSLPPSKKLSDLEMRAILGEIIYGNLEWAYHRSDGNYKMAAYAFAALEALNLKAAFSEQEKSQLMRSALWSCISLNR